MGWLREQTQTDSGKMTGHIYIYVSKPNVSLNKKKLKYILAPGLSVFTFLRQKRKDQ